MKNSKIDNYLLLIYQFELSKRPPVTFCKSHVVTEKNINTVNLCLKDIRKKVIKSSLSNYHMDHSCMVLKLGVCELCKRIFQPQMKIHAYNFRKHCTIVLTCETL